MTFCLLVALRKKIKSSQWTPRLKGICLEICLLLQRIIIVWNTVIGVRCEKFLPRRRINNREDGGTSLFTYNWEISHVSI